MRIGLEGEGNDSIGRCLGAPAALPMPIPGVWYPNDHAKPPGTV